MKILIAGLGAIGSIYAVKLKDAGFEVKVLTDEGRYHRYVENGIIFNGKLYDFDYVLPDDKFFTPDLIIIAVKSKDLKDIIKNISNFINKNTVILSLINGISSEEKIQKAYPDAKILKSYYVGHASMRDGNKITYDGIGKIVFEGDKTIENLFDSAKIAYEVPEDIESSMWQKFIINIGVNQTTAIFKQPYKCFKHQNARNTAEKLMLEGVKIAKKIGIKGYENFIENAFAFIDDVPEDCKTSMFQDIEKGNKTEIDIFAGEIRRLGLKYHITTPYNDMAYNIIKNME